MEKKYGWATSSVDPEKISLTIRGAAKLIPTLVILGGLFGFSLNTAELNAVLDSLLGILLSLFAVYSAGETLWGAVRKVLVRIGVYN